MRFHYSLAVVFGASIAVAAPAPDKEEFVSIEIQGKTNHKLNESFHGGAFVNNHLGELAKTKQKFEGVPFEIGEGLLQLGSKRLADFPEKIEGIKVGKTLTKLHILHACGYVDEEDAVIGHYVVHYADDTTDKIEIAYGKDVRDWWTPPDTPEVTRGKIAWKGENEPTKERNYTLRLYLTSWKNPKPEKKVVSIDYVSAQSISAPFCLAITAECK
jgi:hypothetical protein